MNMLLSCDEFVRLMITIDKWYGFSEAVYDSSDGNIDIGAGPSGELADNYIALIAKMMSAEHPEEENRIMDMLFSWVYECRCGREKPDVSYFPSHVNTNKDVYNWIVHLISSKN